ncbi:MAG: DUF937 domain-containing protein [Parvularculaceae bacterium]|nr:DUF937 domain-containing protein [Parvularculaceae bacterium]
MSMIETLGKAAFSQMTRNASAKTGMNESAVAALMPIATAMLLNGLKKNVARPEGAEALSKALARHDGGLLDNLGRAADDDVMADGQAILGHILGGKQAQAEETLAKASGVGSDQIAKILAMAAPAVLAGLGKAQRQQGLDARSLADYVQSESAKAQTQAPNELSGLLKWVDSDGDGRIDDDIAGLAVKGLAGLFGKR